MVLSKLTRTPHDDACSCARQQQDIIIDILKKSRPSALEATQTHDRCFIFYQIIFMRQRPTKWYHYGLDCMQVPTCFTKDNSSDDILSSVTTESYIF